MRRSTQLRELMKKEGCVFLPGVYNAMTAKLVEKAGFPGCYMTGYGTSLALLGMPDAGLATMTEMHLNARYIANAVNIPVIADSDNGYGNAINVIRTVKEYIQTGVAGIHIEDQVIPKRCGHVAGRRVISIEEACGKYRAADMVRKDWDPDFLIIARTDALGAHGGSLDEAIKRANAYLEAGADLAFIEGPTRKEEVQRIAAEVNGPVLYNQTGISPRFTMEELREMGIALVISPAAIFHLTLTSVWDYLMDLKERGPIAEAELSQKLEQHALGDFHDFAGFKQIREWEDMFLPPEELEKYSGGEGYRP